MKKQIEEMSYSVCNMENKPKNCADCMWKNACNPYLSAEQYYNANYRNADKTRQETATEILSYLYEKIGNSALSDAELVKMLAIQYGVVLE